MAARIILIRHGVTLWNHEFRYQGHTDIALGETGLRQAQLLQKRFSGQEIRAIYSSDLERAVQTAAVIAEPHGIEVITDPRLREINFGVWEGLNYSEIEARYPALLKVWLETPHLLEIPQGETFPAVLERAMSCISEITAGKPAGNTVIVSHGGTISALLCGFLEQPLTRMRTYRQSNAAVNILSINENGVLAETINDISHLEGDVLEG